MQYSNPTEWPQAWPTTIERRHYVSIIGITAFLVLVPTAIATYSLGRGRVEQAVYAGAFAVFCGVITWTGYHIRFRRRKSEARPLTSHCDRNGRCSLVIPYSTQVFTGFALSMGIASITFAIAAIRLYQSGGSGSTGGAVFFGGVALFFSSLPALMVARKFVKGWLLVSPDGVYQRGWTFTSYLPWHSITAVHPYYTDGPCILVLAEDATPWKRRQILRVWKADKLPDTSRDDGRGPQPMIVIRGQFLAADPALVLHLLAYYAKHPEARGELGTEAALRRARAGAFG